MKRATPRLIFPQELSLVPLSNEADEAKGTMESVQIYNSIILSCRGSKSSQKVVKIGDLHSIG